MSPGARATDHPLDSVHELDRLDPALEHGEESAFAALVHRVLPRSQTDISGRSRKPLPIAGGKLREDRDSRDFVGRYHGLKRYSLRSRPRGYYAAR